jgi:hypothetical protein
MMETASTSETSVNFYQTTWRNNQEDSHLHWVICLLDGQTVIEETDHYQITTSNIPIGYGYKSNITHVVQITVDK